MTPRPISIPADEGLQTTPDEPTVPLAALAVHTELELLAAGDPPARRVGRRTVSSGTLLAKCAA